LTWLLDRKQVADALALATALAPFWAYRGRASEGRRWLATALEASAPPSLRANALLAAGTLARADGHYDEALRRLDQARAIHEHLCNETAVANVDLERGRV